MDLRNALDRLRNGKLKSAVIPRSDNVLPAAPVKDVNNSIFCLDKDDLLNFSDEEFLDDRPLSSLGATKPGSQFSQTADHQSSTASSGELSTGVAVKPLLSTGRDTREAESRDRLTHGNSNPCQPLSDSHASSLTLDSQAPALTDSLPRTSQATSFSSSGEHLASVSSSSLRKLKSFTFVKTATKQTDGGIENRSSDGCPPPKRMLMDNGRTLPASPLCSPSPSSSVMEVDDTTVQRRVALVPAQSTCFKQPSSNPRVKRGTSLHPLSTASGCREEKEPRLQRISSAWPGTPSTAVNQTTPTPTTPILSDSPSKHSSSISTRHMGPLQSCNLSADSSSRQRNTFHTPINLPRSQALSSASTPNERSAGRAVRLLRPTTSSLQEPVTTPSRQASRSGLGTPTTGSAQCTPLRTPSSITRLLQSSANSAQPVRRRFPGPAGILPALVPGQSMEGIYVAPASTPTPASTPRRQHLVLASAELLSSSQERGGGGGGGEVGDFVSGPWVDMLQDLNMDDVHSRGLLRFNIARAIRQSARQKLRNGKVTHLRVLLKSIVPAGKSASAILKDPFGEIMCTLHARVVEEHLRELQPGAVLVLRQVSVFSPSPRKHYLNVTADNIVRIYPIHSHSDDHERRPLLLSAIEKKFAEIEQTSCSRAHRQCQDQRTVSVLRSCSNTLSAQQLHSRNKKLPSGRGEPMELEGSLADLSSPMEQRRRSLCMPSQVVPSRKDSSLIQGGTSMTSTSGTVDFISADGGEEDYELSWDDFEDFSLTSETDRGVGSNRPAASSPQATVSASFRESVFSAQLCEDEFDDLFSSLMEEGSVDF